MNENHLRIALAGNPNAGKTSLFNALTKSHHKVGNYPGVTVAKLEGNCTRGERTYHFIDLPGIYSLTAYSLDEVVARDFILDEKPDIILDVLDSTNLERNLYLCLQFQELEIPIVAALNMSDEAEAKGIVIDDKHLSSTLGIPLVRTVGSKGSGIDGILDAIDSVWEKKCKAESANQSEDTSKRVMHYGNEIDQKIAVLEKSITADAAFAAKYPARWFAVKLMEKDENAFERLKDHSSGAKVQAEAREAAAWVDSHFGKDSEIAVSEQRYGYIRGAVRESVRTAKKTDFSFTEKIDSIIMSRYLALPIFILTLWTVFRLTFFIGAVPGEWLSGAFEFIGENLSQIMPEGIVKSLVVDGIIAGVGSVVSFIPLIIVLFLLLSILEDIGYMSRAAFATDKLLHAFGLHGQSVFPMMLGFGCTVPAVMAARTLKSRRDRIITVLITPLMSCGAKLPVYVLLSAALFPQNPANMVMLMYIIGVVLSLICSMVLKRILLSGEPTPFVMELPPYRAPTLRGILWHVWEKIWMYAKRAATVILAASVIIWAITFFPVPSDDNGSAGEISEQARLEQSIAGRIGHGIEPVFRPLGFDWKIAVASLTGFVAKEVIVSTLGVLYGTGGESDDEGIGLQKAIAQDENFTPLVGLVLMLFTLIIPPCFASLATIKMELGTKWLIFEIGFLLALGWTIAFAVFRIGTMLGF